MGTRVLKKFRKHWMFSTLGIGRMGKVLARAWEVEVLKGLNSHSFQYPARACFPQASGIEGPKNSQKMEIASFWVHGKGKLWKVTGMVDVFEMGE